MKVGYLLLSLVFFVLRAGSAGAVELTVREPSGIGRVEEPVTCGVPFAQGEVKSADELVLKMGPRQIPVEVREVSRWPDGALAWVHLDFQLSVDASQEKHLLLEKGERETVDTKLVVEELENQIRVATGKIQAEVLKRNFNLFNWVRVADSLGNYNRSLVAPHLSGLVALADSVEYRASNDENSSAAVESQGPMRVVLRCEGDLKSREGASLLHYICRLYFFNDSPVVRLAFTIENRDPVIENRVVLEGLHVELPTVLRGTGSAFDIGGPENDYQDVFGQSDALAFTQGNNSEQMYFGTEMYWEQSLPPKQAKSDRVGWLSLGSAAGQVGVGLRYFWQMHPSALVLYAHDGFIQVGIIPARLKPKVTIYAGVARTHYLNFAFLAQGNSELMRSLVASCQKPLVAAAPANYYCEQTKSFGRLPSRKMLNYPEENREIVHYVDDELDRGLANMLKLIDGRTVKGTTRDSYGYLEWGDGLHYAWQPGVDDLGNLSWDNNYYDLPHVCLLEFVRTGRLDWYEYFFAHSNHMMDLHMCHFGPDNELTGHNRYNPATEHVRLDPKDSNDYTSAQVYVSPTQAHAKTQGIFDRWLLCGDERARDVGLEGLRYAAGFGAYSDFRQPRGAAHQVMTLVYGYRITGDKKYLDVARSTFEIWLEHFRQTDEKFTLGYFMVGFLLEAFIDYYEVTGDERVVGFEQQALDWMAANRPADTFPNLALAAGFLAARLGDPKYTALQIEYLAQWKGEQNNAFKDFASHGRSLARSLYYLSNEGRERRK
ncbi:MAG TPA: hypothetical protein VJ417_14685 [Candidatus Glassbacteria bacterium]|nr:hypothetical protein [Candidatus Glassbacteria bacterium]